MNEKNVVRILIVDDEQIDAMVLRRYLSGSDEYAIETEHVTNAAQALYKLSNEHFDLIFLDNKLSSVMTAKEVLESFREQEIEVPVIIVTGQGDEQTAVELMKGGAYDYITKTGLSTKLLEKTIRGTLERYTLITRQRQLEEKLIEQNHMKSMLIITISHELREQLCTFKNIISDAVGGLLGPISAKLHKNLEIAEKSVERLEKIISDFLDISRIETGKIQLRRTRVDMEEVVSEAVFLLTDLAAEKKMKLLAALPPDPSFTVYADRSLVMQILVNLIDNAIKFSPMGGTIRITVRDMEDELQIDIQSTGVGAGSEDISNVFNRFIQIEEYAGPGSHGAGLGLYIAKQLVKAQGGRIWAESTSGTGNVFCFTLPKYSEQVGVSAVEVVKVSQQNRD